MAKVLLTGKTPLIEVID